MFVKDLVYWVFVWEASVYDVYELSSQVSFHVSVPWGIVPNDFSFAISVARWLWVVCVLVVVAVLVKRFLVRWDRVVENFLAR